MRNHEIILRLMVKIQEETDGRFTAECIELGTATYGNTFEEANEAIIEAIKLHLDTLAEVGELKNFLKENNVKIYNKKQPPPTQVRLPYPVIKDAYLREYQIPVYA